MLVPPGASLLGVWAGPPSHVLISSSYKDTVLWGRGHPGDLTAPPSPLLKTHLHIQPRSEVLGGDSFNIQIWGRTRFSPENVGNSGHRVFEGLKNSISKDKSLDTEAADQNVGSLLTPTDSPLKVLEATCVTIVSLACNGSPFQSQVNFQTQLPPHLFLVTPV